MSFFVTLTGSEGRILVNPDCIAMCEERKAETLITLRSGQKISVSESLSKIAKLCESLLQ
ncbi:flagellar FlbD family protein [Candidatus Binatus sp.]|uniref:flagellar FlbD family protein n=1 Tax=Candidatus Binatus sp. TaxID=2811406 RepID=UPI00351D1ACA